ncbi:hypothetical protein PFISCL1PPCAC_26077, partial [Pristionchus fissidentatus]
APPPQAAAYARPPPAVKRAEQAGDTGNVHGSPLSVFDNQQSSAAYTASWVSSTSSLPPDLKESPEGRSSTQLLQDGHIFHQMHVGARTTMPGNEWVQPGGGGGAAAAAAAVDYGGTWGERRDESMFAAAHTTGGGAAGSTFDHSQFARMNMDDSHHQSYSSAALGGVAAAAGGGVTGGEWNSPEKNHPQQGIKFQTNAWQTNNLNQSQNAPQPLMMLAQQPMQQQQQQQNMHQNKGKPMGGFSPMGGKQGGGQRGGNGGGGGPGGDGYNKDMQSLSWEERLKKAQGAKERAERPEDREQRHYGNSNGANNGGAREGGVQRGGRGGGGVRGRGGRGGERQGGFRDAHHNAGGEGAGMGMGGGGERSAGGNQGWKGGPPEAVAQAQQGGDAGAFPMMPFGMQGMQQQGGWRGGMRGGLPQQMRGGGGQPMHMQMRGAANAAARGTVHPMMMRGPMGGGGFAMMPPSPAGAMPAALAGMHAPQEERFRSTWLDASICLPALMGIPGGGPPMMNPMMMGGGMGGPRGGTRGGFGAPRGGGGGFRGNRGGMGGGGRGRGYYNNRESPRQRDRETTADGEIKEEERTPVDSPAAVGGEEAAAVEEQQ